MLLTGFWRTRQLQIQVYVVETLNQVVGAVFVCYHRTSRIEVAMIQCEWMQILVKIYRSWRSICHRIDRAASVLMNQVFHLRAYAWREGKLVKRLVLKELDRMASNGNRTRHQACTNLLLVKTKSCDSHADYVSCNRPSWIKWMTIVYSKTWQ